VPKTEKGEQKVPESVKQSQAQNEPKPESEKKRKSPPAVTSSQATVTSSVTKTQVSTTSSVRSNDSSSPSNQITSNTLAMSVASVIAERILTPSPPVQNDTRTVHEYKYRWVPSTATESHCIQLSSINCDGTPLYTAEFHQK
jgi:hypothetical protein